MRTGQASSAPVHHLFMMTGASPNTNWLQGSVALDEKGFILTPALRNIWILVKF
jgi:thioredoxin reductase (NADPH)